MIKHFSFCFLPICALMVASCGEKKQVVEIPPRPIAWVEAELVGMEQVRKISGVLEPSTNTVLSFEVGGRIKDMKVNLGDTFFAGEILATIDNRNYDLNVKASEGQVEQAKAEQVEAESNYKRYEKLFRSGDVTESVYDNAKTLFETSKSAVEIAVARLNIAKKDLTDTVLKAPYTGRVSNRLLEPSQQVKPGEPVFEIESDQGLDVSLRIPENIIQNVALGQTVSVRFPALRDVMVDATVIEIGSQAMTANTFPVNLKLNEEHKDLRAGMTAEVDFTFELPGRTGYTGAMIKIPLSAIIPVDKMKSYVFVYDATESMVYRRDVQTENIINNEVLLSSGLQAGEIVATAGVTYLHDKQPVTLLDEGYQIYN